MTDPTIRIALDPVVLAVTDDEPRVLTVHEHALDQLPSGPLDGDGDATLERALRERVERRTGLALGYVEQLYTFGDRFRDSRSTVDDERCISVAYLALVRENEHDPARAKFQPVYAYLPWEDWRDGRPQIIDDEIAPQLSEWTNDDDQRRERVSLTFGLDGAPWDPERTLERYELLWEAGLVDESPRFRRSASLRPLGSPMALDHRRMVATALGRVRGKLKYRPVVFELLAEEFTLLKLQRTVEALAGARLHKQNFRRLVETAGLVEHTGRFESLHRGRPAELFRFRHEVFRERPAPGVYFAGAWWSR